MLIGMVGLKRSGKDTAADYLIKTCPTLSKWAFAKPIKDLVDTLYAFEMLNDTNKEEEFWCDQVLADVGRLRKFEQLYYYYGLNSYLTTSECWKLMETHIGGLIKGNLRSPREVYQLFGTEVCRNNMDEKVWMHIAPLEDTIISDVRFLDEANYIKSHGGVLIKIDRKLPHSDNHQSEVEVDQIVCHHTVDNTGGLEHLYRQLDRILRTLK